MSLSGKKPSVFKSHLSGKGNQESREEDTKQFKLLLLNKLLIPLLSQQMAVFHQNMASLETWKKVIHHFKTVQAVKEASLEELKKAINNRMAEIVYAHFRNEKSRD